VKKCEKVGLHITAITDRADRDVTTLIESSLREIRNALKALNRDPDAEWGSLTIENLLSLLKATRGQKGAPKKKSTTEKIRRIASLLAQDRSGRSFALEIFPEKLTRNLADLQLRRFRSKHRPEIDAEILRLKQN
jgi:hypothetical protein